MQTPVITRPLTDAEMEHVLSIIGAAETPGDALIDGTFAVFDALLADAGLTVRGNFSADSPLRGSNLKIPRRQWMVIGEALKAVPTGTLTSTNVLLDWMNIGPSAYEEDSP